MPESPANRLLSTQLTDLRLPSKEIAFEQIFNWGIENAPQEICGILVEEGPREYRLVKLVNRAEDPTAMYRIDPATLHTLALRPAVWNNIAIWHTHPGGLVGPSTGDIEHKIEHLVYYVITIPTGEVVQF